MESSLESNLLSESKPPTNLTLPWGQLPKRVTGRLRKPKGNSCLELSSEFMALFTIAKVAEKTKVDLTPSLTPVTSPKLMDGSRTSTLSITWEKPDPPPLYLRWESINTNSQLAPSVPKPAELNQQKLLCQCLFQHQEAMKVQGSQFCNDIQLALGLDEGEWMGFNSTFNPTPPPPSPHHLNCLSTSRLPRKLVIPIHRRNM